MKPGSFQNGRSIVAGRLVAVCLAAATLSATPVLAQTVVLTANDSPITNYDIAQRMKLLSILRMPASAQAATESLVEDRLKLLETRKYGISVSEQEISNEATRDAGERKISPQQLSAGIQRAGIDKNHWQEHWRAAYSWRGLVGAINKAVSVSEEEVRAEMQKKGSTIGSQEFRLQQVIFVVPASASVATYNARFSEATNLRSRFRDCTAGLQLARALRDVAIQPQISRRANTLSAELVSTLDRTPVGQLSPPSRGPTGVEMLAVCGKSDAGSGSSASESIRDTLLMRKLQVDAEKRYAELRKRAVIVKK